MRAVRERLGGLSSEVAAAQRFSDSFDVKPLHKALDRFAAEFCPAAREFRCSLQWSLMQVEYARVVIGSLAINEMTLIPAIARADTP